MVVRASLWLLVSTFSIGFALLADGLSGGKVSSISALWRDIIELDPGALLRLLWWLMVLLPAAMLINMVRVWTKARHSS